MSAQKAKPKNDSNYDERMLHFGFSMGLNTMDFNIKLSDEAIANKTTVETVSLKPGINIQIVTDFRPSTYLDVRFLPRVSFGQRNVSFYDSTGTAWGSRRSWSRPFLNFPLPEVQRDEAE
ncbi:MAG: hypothetical protein MZV63_04720 [Marinilabiliales bacterium]|nr:hypothetical protein [Marinilabiliales bacterium]